MESGLSAWALNSRAGIFRRHKRTHPHREKASWRQRGCNEATGKGLLGLAEAARGRKDSSRSFEKKMKPCQHLDFGFLTFRTVMECISTINHPEFGHFFFVIALGKTSTYQYFLLYEETFPLPTTPSGGDKEAMCFELCLVHIFLL